jgi:hypothetical protein
MAILPEESQVAVRTCVGRRQAILANIISQAVTDGELPAYFDPDPMAWYYLGIMHAIMTLPCRPGPSGTVRRLLRTPYHPKTTTGSLPTSPATALAHGRSATGPWPSSLAMRIRALCGQVLPEYPPRIRSHQMPATAGAPRQGFAALK